MPAKDGCVEILGRRSRRLEVVAVCAESSEGIMVDGCSETRDGKIDGRISVRVVKVLKWYCQ